MFFLARDASDHPDELWVSDGTPEGTSRLRDLNPAGKSDVSGITPFAEGVLFFVSSGDLNNPGAGLWYSDGTTAGTRLVNRPVPWGHRTPIAIGVYGGRFYFAEADFSYAQVIWSSDGSTQGTNQLLSVANLSVQKPYEADTWLTEYRNKVHFYGTPPIDIYDFSSRPIRQIYSTEGREFDLKSLTNATQPATTGTSKAITVFKDRLFFSWNSPDTGAELWTSDGTAAGTRLLVETLPGIEGGTPSNFQVANDYLLFFAYGPEKQVDFRKALWRTDGTAAGTELLGKVEILNNTNMVAMNGRFYFAGARHGTWNTTLWSTDGTAAGTYEVSDAVDPANSLQAKNMVVLGKRILFQGRRGQASLPWTSDGTRAGTVMLKEVFLRARQEIDPPGWVAVRGDKAYFVGAPIPDNYQLFETDGTGAGTRAIAPADASVTANPMGKATSPLSVFPNPVPVPAGGFLIFRGNFHGAGGRLYRM
ncbi:hypothetical protein LZ009_08995 [Ramlibacter sp. XY19]|uniref:hypothetical protein n=1 Tax=Ramlibacter paludis TaxID=2908000 RepID=UPI0023D9812F|nr:hypothetical protein [Ramlibacter paludis]